MFHSANWGEGGGLGGNALVGKRIPPTPQKKSFVKGLRPLQKFGNSPSSSYQQSPPLLRSFDHSLLEHSFYNFLHHHIPTFVLILHTHSHYASILCTPFPISTPSSQSFLLHLEITRELYHFFHACNEINVAF